MIRKRRNSHLPLHTGEHEGDPQNKRKGQERRQTLLPCLPQWRRFLSLLLCQHYTHPSPVQKREKGRAKFGGG